MIATSQLQPSGDGVRQPVTDVTKASAAAVYVCQLFAPCIVFMHGAVCNLQTTLADVTMLQSQLDAAKMVIRNICCTLDALWVMQDRWAVLCFCFTLLFTLGQKLPGGHGSMTPEDGQ